MSLFLYMLLYWLLLFCWCSAIYGSTSCWVSVLYMSCSLLSFRLPSAEPWCVKPLLFEWAVAFASYFSMRSIASSWLNCSSVFDWKVFCMSRIWMPIFLPSMELSGEINSRVWTSGLYILFSGWGLLYCRLLWARTGFTWISFWPSDDSFVTFWSKAGGSEFL